jgi:hypothetical protein
MTAVGLKKRCAAHPTRRTCRIEGIGRMGQRERAAGSAGIINLPTPTHQSIGARRSTER